MSGTIIQVNSTAFFINRTNPFEIKYLPQDAPETEIEKWQMLIVESYLNKCREPVAGEILYQYTINRGCYIKLSDYVPAGTDINRPPVLNNAPASTPNRNKYE